MLPFDATLRMALDKGKSGSASDFLTLAMRGAGVWDKAIVETLNYVPAVRWEDEPPFEGHPEKRLRGWYWDKIPVIPVEWQGTLHEARHAWDEARLGSTQAYDDKRRILAFQVAVYGTLERDKAFAVDCEPEMLDFLRDYYEGIATWPGMYDWDGAGPNKKVRLGDLWNPLTIDIANIIIGEVDGGIVSKCMGWVDKGPNRLPQPMRWIYQDFFTGNPIGTPYYMVDGVP